MNRKNDYLIGMRFETKNSGWLTVLEPTELRKSRNKLYLVEFDEVNGVKHKVLARADVIREGNIKNPYYQTVLGVGYLGEDIHPKEHRILYDRWRNMLMRCYKEDSLDYQDYGAKGVKVSDRWLCFKNFVEDYPLIEGYDEKNLSNLSLDKDMKSTGETKIYSLETCVLINIGDNVREMNKRVHQKEFVAISPNGESSIENNKRDFCKKHSFPIARLYSILRGEIDSYKGWTFNKKEITQ